MRKIDKPPGASGGKCTLLGRCGLVALLSRFQKIGTLPEGLNRRRALEGWWVKVASAERPSRSRSQLPLTLDAARTGVVVVAKTSWRQGRYKQKLSVEARINRCTCVRVRRHLRTRIHQRFLAAGHADRRKSEHVVRASSPANTFGSWSPRPKRRLLPGSFGLPLGSVNFRHRGGAMMNFYKRGLIFATFLGCCLSLSFLAASLSTDRWVIARVQRSTNPSESDGHVFFGLFTGRRELNVGYGWRTYSLSGTSNSVILSRRVVPYVLEILLNHIHIVSPFN